MLREQVGTETFWRGIRLYYQRHMNGLASSDDLRRAMEQVSGQNLSWFFQQWLHRSGVPAIEGSWRYDAVAKQVIVTVRQSQAADPYRISLGVGVVQSAGTPPRIQQVAFTGRETTVTIASDAEPASVVLDPNVSLLADFGTFAKSSTRPATMDHR